MELDPPVVTVNDIPAGTALRIGLAQTLMVTAGETVDATAGQHLKV